MRGETQFEPWCAVALDGFFLCCVMTYPQHQCGPAHKRVSPNSCLRSGEKNDHCPWEAHTGSGRYGFVFSFTLAFLGNKGQSHVLKLDGNAAFGKSRNQTCYKTVYRAEFVLI